MNNQKKLTIAVIILAVIALVVVTVWQPAELGFKDQTDYEALEQQAEAEVKEYQALLASLNPNYAASQQLLEKIATEEIVRKEVEETLQVNQQISVPVIANNELKISDRSDEDFVVNYLTDLNSMVGNYNNSITAANQNLYTPGADSILLTRAQGDTTSLVENIKRMEVPAVAVDLHKAQLATYQKYAGVFDNAKQYARGEVSEPWANLYGNYAAINNQMGVINSQANRLASLYPHNPGIMEQLGIIRTANAQFGGVTIFADLERAVEWGIRAGLSRAFANFSITMLDKLVAHIEKNFAIASQLYYSNDLGRYYSVEYMKRFVEDPLDQNIIQKFLPEYFCVNPQAGELSQVFRAKARENVGTDIVINPADPDFLQKLARLGGDAQNYPQWWEGYYESLAAQTKAEAQAAATKEVLSPGVKTGRDLINGQVVKTVSAITGVQESAINGVMDLGTNNTENVVSQLVAGVIENLVNKFVFTAIGSDGQGGGSISIVKESDVCLQTPQVKPIVPIAQTNY